MLMSEADFSFARLKLRDDRLDALANREAEVIDMKSVEHQSMRDALGMDGKLPSCVRELKLM